MIFSIKFKITINPLCVQGITFLLRQTELLKRFKKNGFVYMVNSQAVFILQ